MREQIADRLAEKNHTLNSGQLVEVKRFVELLQAWEKDREVTHAWAHLAEPAFEVVWNNPEDDAYDAI